MIKTIVIYHSADFDGIFCREIARKFLPDAELIGWDYGNPVPVIPKDSTLYMLDISVDGLMDHPNLVWIDHHKSAIEKYVLTHEIKGYRIDGVGACRLAWQWFALADQSWKDGEGATPKNPNKGFYVLPEKQDFIDRTVTEPLAIRLAGEYDIWDKRDPDAELFQHGLRSREITEHTWQLLLSIGIKKAVSEIEGMIDAGHPFELRPDGTVDESVGIVKGLLHGGEVLQFARTNENASIIKEIGFTLHWEGLTFLACNAARYNSHLFTAGLTPEHDACFGFKWTGKDWSVSLYHAPGKEHHDLSLIAVKHGGGGHKGACGFRTSKLSFVP